MIIKKFIGKTEEEATAEAKKELGANIVVMNVRSVKQSGFLSFLKPQRIEVTVALENEREESRQSRGGIFDSETRNAGRSSFSVVTPNDISDKRPEGNVGEQLKRATEQGLIPPLKVKDSTGAGTEVNHTRDALQSLTAEMQGRDNGQRNSKEEKIDPVTAPKQAESAIEEKLDNLSNLLEKNIQTPQPVSALERMRSSQSAEKTTVQNDLKDTDSDEMISFLKVLYNTLLQNEVDERYANELTDEVAKIKKKDVPIDFVLASVYQKMILKFGKAEEITPSSDDCAKAEIFIGPTGVGKTTTIAKLASQLHLQKKKVALITVDTYRIAAAEQLHTYASIMGIPFRVVYSIEEMKQVIEDFRDYDHLMVDTAGHSPHNQEQKKNIGEFVSLLRDELDHDIFLVLSATTKYRDLIEIADGYREIAEYKLIFTKIDETGALGNMYNVKMHTGAPVSYITNGQNVPDDIAVFDAQKAVKELLGGKRELAQKQE